MREPKMLNKALLVFIFCAIQMNPLKAMTSETRKHCCNVGTSQSMNGAACTTLKPPIIGVNKQDETQCLHFADLCCKNQFKEAQCKLGLDDAKSGAGCSTSADPERKTCCEACQLGLETGKSGESCQDTLGLGPPYDQHFISCCEKPTTTSTSTATTRASSINSPFSRPTQATNENFDPMPSMESLCDSGELCAHICEPTNDSYRCACYKGYALMSDGISCKPDKISGKRGGRCEHNHPCHHKCTDTGTAIKCSCRDGYELALDNKTCKDIDECATKLHDCTDSEECINEEGSYVCYDSNGLDEDDVSYDSKCPLGYKFNGENQVCNDIDECQFDIMCPRPKTCKNTIGSFICEGDDRPTCPPGFYFKPAINTCSDIDECITGENDCNKESQTCLNNIGNYTCVDKASKKTCPPGFKKNMVTEMCDDVDECEENLEICRDDEICINEPGGYSCKPSKKPTTSTTSTTTTTTTPKPTKPPNRTCSKGYKFSSTFNNCVDIDECYEDRETCDSNQDCYNTPGSFVCSCKLGFTKDYHTGACVDINECQIGTHDCTVAERCDNTVGSFHCARITGCGTGYTLNYANGLCEDDDECHLGTHNCNELGPSYKCRNMLGSYRCDVIRPVSRPVPVTTTTTTTKQPTTSTTSKAPYAVRPTYPVLVPQKPFSVPDYSPPAPYYPPSSPSYPSRIPPPSYNNFPVRAPTYSSPARPINAPSPSYPVNGQYKKCLPGYVMNERGQCDDINECDSNPCPRGQKCVNFNGRFQCMSPMECPLGFELDDDLEKCVDVNECARGTHSCKKTQICINGDGYYVCDCPVGHHFNQATKICEDMDECKLFRPCGVYSECVNTLGSFECKCGKGLVKFGNQCTDVDECKQAAGLCEHTCVNTWSSYKCACRPGFILNYDNRTCNDMDECERFKDKRLCVGTCKNTPGTYTCECPKGYNLGTDKRGCRDIDECSHNVCGSDDICLNTRGGYKCYNIQCPNNYMKDPGHRARCRKPQHLCDVRDYQCLLMPEQYTYHYITITSNMPLPESGHIKLFQISGPQWFGTHADFSLELEEVICPYNVQRAKLDYFQKYSHSSNILHIRIVKSIQGPQEIKLKLEMTIYHNNISQKHIAYITIVVSEYSF